MRIAEKFQLRHIGILLAMLLVPAIALIRLTRYVPWEYLLAGALLLSLLSFTLMGIDKRKATQAQWRIPEKHLHFLEICGGWPGSYVAQRLFWHKVSKVSYQAIFWSIVAIFQYMALDYLLDWRMSQTIGSFVQQILKA